MFKSQVLGWWWTTKVILNPVNPVQNCEVITDIPTVCNQDIVEKVRTEVLNLKGKYISEDGLSVNYKDIGKSEDLVQYELTLPLLHKVNLEVSSEVERTAFFVNIYNAIVTHAVARCKLTPKTALAQLERLKFYATYSYIIGEYPYCLNDIENGILRGNRPSPVPFTSVPFRAGDARSAFCVKCDPRIHFALNCGAKSCPPIAVYSSEPSVFESQLVMATELFLDDNVSIEPASQYTVIRLSKIFDWYKMDFGATDTVVIEWIRDHASATLRAALDPILSLKNPLKVVYSTYDWNLNN